MWSMTRRAALYPGASYPVSADFIPEILLADSNDELLEDTELSDKKTLEAKIVAEEIRHLMKTQPVTDKATGELRAARYSDIVILLRSLSGWADSLVEVLNGNGIPAHRFLQPVIFHGGSADGTVHAEAFG